MTAPLHNATRKLLETVTQTVRQHKMFCLGDSVLVGVSGGADSVALLHLLRRLAPGFSIRIAIAHLNHSLRQEESDRDASFVAALAKKLGLPCHSDKRDVRQYQRQHRLSLEEAARQVRYAFYEEVAEKNGFDKVALGHHADDNAELVLMYLFRGSGLTGLSGIPPVRNEKFVRPLIRVSRKDIKAFIAENRLEYVSDSTNQDPLYLRNRIRHHLLPMIRASYNPNIADTLNRLASIVRCDDEWLEETTEAIFRKSISGFREEELRLSVPMLRKTHLAAQRRLVRKAIAQVKGDLRRITYAHVEAVQKLLQKGAADGSLDLPDRVHVVKTGDSLCFSKGRARGAEAGIPFTYTVSAPGMVFIQEIGASLSFSVTPRENAAFFNKGSENRVPQHPGQSGYPVCNYFDMDTLTFPMTIRNFRPGDRFTPLGMSGTQKVKKYFINNKIPRAERARCPILLCQGKIIWVVGHRMADFARVRASTRNMLKVEFFLPNS
ncbi:MAG: tRNA lysidine(34) synthetase TilS [Desulfobacteraceae bacterium 4572_88]|nr:MAG: tRNA lysidine(34) synthetase TilS [Desulfobacteraceae bacterium 4572_88]